MEARQSRFACGWATRLPIGEKRPGPVASPTSGARSHHRRQAAVESRRGVDGEVASVRYLFVPGDPANMSR